MLFFVMVEFNVDDLKELKRVTQIELSGKLDKDGLKAFVEASWYNWFFVTVYDARNLQSISESPRQNNHNHPMKKIIRFTSKGGGCLDGKQHLQLGDLSGSGGMKSITDALGSMGGDKSNKKRTNKKETKTTKDGKEEENKAACVHVDCKYDDESL